MSIFEQDFVRDQLSRSGGGPEHETPRGRVEIFVQKVKDGRVVLGEREHARVMAFAAGCGEWSALRRKRLLAIIPNSEPQLLTSIFHANRRAAEASARPQRGGVIRYGAFSSLRIPPVVGHLPGLGEVVGIRRAA